MSDPKGPPGSESSEPKQASAALRGEETATEMASSPALAEETVVEAPSSRVRAEETATGGAPTADAPGDDSPRRKKRKKRKKEASEELDANPLRPELDGRGRERPRFLLRFPVDPELEPLIAAFEAGNYFKLRDEAPRVIERTLRPEVKAAAQELLRRIEPDPLVKFFLGVSVALFVAVVLYVYYSHG